MIRRSYKQVLLEFGQYPSAQLVGQNFRKGKRGQWADSFPSVVIWTAESKRKPMDLPRKKKKCFDNDVRRLLCTGLSDCTKYKVTPMPSSLQRRGTFLTQALCQCCEGRDRPK